MARLINLVREVQENGHQFADIPSTQLSESLMHHNIIMLISNVVNALVIPIRQQFVFTIIVDQMWQFG